jgi:hypothetical protein
MLFRLEFQHSTALLIQCRCSLIFHVLVLHPLLDKRIEKLGQFLLLLNTLHDRKPYFFCFTDKSVCQSSTHSAACA